MLLQDLQKIDSKVTQDELSAVLSDISRNADEIKERDYPGLIARIQSARPGAIAAPTKPVPKPTAAPLAVAPKPDRPAESAPAVVPTGEDPVAALKARIEALKQKQLLADLEKQAIDAENAAIAAEEELIAAKTQLAERKTAHNLQVAAAEALTALAVKNGQALGENLISRQEQSLGELLTVSQETKLDCEIGVQVAKQRQVAQQNKFQTVLNATPAALPPMSQETGRSEMKTVEAVAV